MRLSRFVPVLVAVLALPLASCQEPTAPEPNLTVTPSMDVSASCAGRIVAGIASTWPWAHEDGAVFPPPPGSIALWIQVFGPSVGVSNVHDLQVLFCSAT